MDLSKVDWRFAHPKPDLLVSINVATILRSPFLAQSLAQAFGPTSDGSNQTANQATLDAILKMAGTMDRVQLSLHSTPGSSDSDILVLITGGSLTPSCA